MRFICIAAFVLIFGITSSTAIGPDVQSSCTKNGGPEAHEFIKSGSDIIETCYKSVIKEWNREVQTSEITGYTLFAMLCNKVDTLNFCVTQPMDVIRSCIAAGPHQDENTVVVYNIKPLILQFACENRKILEEGLKSPDRECLASKLQAVKMCAYNFLIYENTTISADPSKYATDLVEILSNLKNGSNGQVCSGIQNFEQCSIDIANQCEDQTFSKLLDSMANYMKNETVCESLPIKSPKSEASSPGSVVNILLLLIAVITMFY